MISFLNACEKKRSIFPHFYLDLIGVHPDKQGLGYASTLLSRAISRLDIEGIPAYLQSSNIRNNPLTSKMASRSPMRYALKTAQPFGVCGEPPQNLRVQKGP
jgi:GNAT superfamily N-acetyltransferase